MLYIVTDSSCMLQEKDSPHSAFRVAPLHIQCGDASYLDGVEISSEEVCSFCKSGGMPVSSQPSIGEKLEIYDSILEDPENTILDITIADGLSGTYQTACMARQTCTDPERVTVFNSQTLAGPQRQLVEEAIVLRDAGLNADEIIQRLQKKSERDLSMVAVRDCLYLSHSGRVSSFVGHAGALMKLVPVAAKVDHGQKLHLIKTARTMKKAIQTMVSQLQSQGADSNYTFYVAHADAASDAACAARLLQETFPGAEIVTEALCPLFVVHGGPGALSIQALPKA